MIIVNVWEGHASFVTNPGAGMPKTTVSWWPRYGELAILDSEPYVMPYATELMVEAGTDQKRYQIFTLNDYADGVPGAREHVGLDLTAIHAWWQQWQSGRYRLLDHNCCCTVMCGLIAGGARQYTGLAGYEFVEPDGNFMTPNDVDPFCQAIIRGMDTANF
jgi:hypothetical protein